MSTWDQVEKLKIQILLTNAKQIASGKPDNPDDFVLSYLKDSIQNLEWSLEAFEGAVCTSNSS